MVRVHALTLNTVSMVLREQTLQSIPVEDYSIIYHPDGFGNVANKVRKVTVVEDHAVLPSTARL